MAGQAICRWGILGTATIARKNWQAIRLASNATLVAVASRDLSRGRQFISECQAHVPFQQPPAALGSYDELLASDQVDAVYVPLPTAVRKQWVVRAAEAGKHVMCEKPCGVDAGEVAQMVEACQQNNVQFMDGVMFMHSSRLNQLRAALDDGQSVGRLRRIASQFSFQGDKQFLAGNIRTTSNLEPLGCLGDLGWYNVCLTLWVMNWQMPEQVRGRTLDARAREDSPRPVPLEFSAELFFRDGVSASFYCSFQTENQQWANLSGSKGNIHLTDFVLPYFGNEVAFDISRAVFHQSGCDFNMEAHTRRVAVAEYSNSMPTAQETRMFQSFSQLALSGQVDRFWPQVAWQTQRVLDACLQSAQSDGRLVSLDA